MADAEDIQILLNPQKYRAFLWAEKRAIDARGAPLRGSKFAERQLKNVDFEGADLQNASFHFAQLRNVIFRGANLQGAIFNDADLRSCDFRSSDLSLAAFRDAALSGGDASGAKFRDAGLERAAFREINLAGADFANAYCDRTIWAGVDLRAVLNLDKVRHRGPSSVGLDTVSASAGEIPEPFLRGCGVADALIAYVRGVGQSRHELQAHSCFISYSTKDQEFCERLHEDLVAAGIRCWFAPDNLTIGDRFRDPIETALRSHDKVLVVLSANSLDSSWVRSEVEGAFDRENRESKLVLFPLRIDDAVVDTSQSWAADIRRQRHIGDFSGWRDREGYRRAFDRLLRDLRAVPHA